MNIAMISRWHVHADEYANALKAAPGCRIGAVYHEQEPEGRAWAASLGCPFVDSVERIFSDPAIDAVAINAATNRHAELLCAAAQAGKAIFTEKVLTPTAQEAERVREAVERAGVRFVISFPHLTRPELIFAKQVVARGALGKLSYARVRNVHDGASAGWLPPHFYDPEQCGGGAMIDLGAHPMYTLCWLMGDPLTVQSCFQSVTRRAVEDNAVSVLGFPGGAIGVAETGFVSGGNPYTLELSGDKGALMIHNGLRYCCPETGNRWVEPERLPEAQPLPVLQFADAARSGDPLAAFGIGPAVRLSRVMDAAYRAHRTGRVAEI